MASVSALRSRAAPPRSMGLVCRGTWMSNATFRTQVEARLGTAAIDHYVTFVSKRTVSSRFRAAGSRSWNNRYPLENSGLEQASNLSRMSGWSDLLR
jgi:hypothetical protein